LLVNFVSESLPKKGPMLPDHALTLSFQFMPSQPSKRSMIIYVHVWLVLLQEWVEAAQGFLVYWQRLQLQPACRPGH
jgi:hypothetical protein